MNLLLIDGSNIVLRCALGGDIPPDPAVATASAMIERVARDLQATHLVLALDVPGVPSWRKQEYPAYKAHRTRDTTPWLFAAHLAWTRRGWWVEAVNGFEADDILATLVQRCNARPSVTVWVVSGDSDLLPLLGEAHLLKPVKGGRFEAMDTAAVLRKYGVLPGQLPDLKALTGESGDNIPGVEGIGPVRARQLLEVHGTLDRVIAAGQSGTCKYAVRVAEHAGVARLARRLVTLHREVPIVPIQPKACALTPTALV